MPMQREKGWMGKLADRLDVIPDADLGAMFKEYLRESIHGGFDGFSPRDLVGAKNLIQDIDLFIENYYSKPLHDHRLVLDGRYVILRGDLNVLHPRNGVRELVTLKGPLILAHQRKGD